MTSVMTKPKPRILIQFRCTAKEKRAIRKSAAWRGVSVSRWLRDAARLKQIEDFGQTQ